VESVESAKKILFICSSPEGKDSLNSLKEFKYIEKARQEGEYRDSYMKPVIKTSVEADDLLRILVKNQPDILHFSLHSSRSEGMYFENVVGEADPVSAEYFKDVISAYTSKLEGKRKIETVVLLSCNSEPYGIEIADFTENLLVTKDFFPDQAATLYTKEFYRTLFDTMDIAFAHQAARIAIKRQKYPGEGYNYPIHEIPELIKNKPQ
jgi:hypothetical protein